ncbi:RING-H2 finger protein ATL3-like [Hordeum vulgare subsp. vulgare]|uniref:RING-type domain-containing protein n=1 Tax=Hordeum vulgare subsp. vulgare TaxID=112509 RepID=A0A8I6XRI0_HORVV|nr:RING-H2 finger protein ATL3-like [Hordeum vulgare subsp. vulgare]
MEPIRVPTRTRIPIIYQVVEDREPADGQEFLARGVRDWMQGRLPLIDQELDMLQRQLEAQQQSRHEDEDEERFWPGLVVPASRDAVLQLPETTGAPAGARLQQTECAVCLKDFEVEDRVTTMPCDHYFHQGCISEWLKVSCVCPLCRHALPAASPQARQMEVRD